MGFFAFCTAISTVVDTILFDLWYHKWYNTRYREEIIVMRFNYNDGGRAKYFTGKAGDCVTRAVAIATGLDYKDVYNNIKHLIGHTPRNGISKTETRKIMRHYGFTWVSVMKVGEGCTTHLREDELPNKGTIICQVTKHVTTVIDGVINDTFDPSRNGTRCVYGYWVKKEVA